MNWDAIGAIGDLIGGVAVVLSLLYVAYQIRQSSRQIELSSRNIEASTYHETGDAFSRWLTLVAALGAGDADAGVPGGGGRAAEPVGGWPIGMAAGIVRPD